MSAPPRWAQAIARAVLPPEWRESVIGDLEEGWARRVERGERPHLWYCAQLLSLRPARMRSRVAAKGESVTEAGRTGASSALASLPRSLAVGGRGLLRAPGFATLSAGILALGIAGATLLFSLADTLFFRPMSFDDPETLYAVLNTHAGEEGALLEYSAGPLDFLRWKDEAGFADLGALSDRTMTLETADGAEVVRGAAVSAGFFTVLGRPAELGRVFSEEEDRSGATRAVLSWGFWQSRFAGQTLDGQTVVLDGRAYDVVGVMPRGFGRELGEWPLWIPLGLTYETLQGPQNRMLRVFGRTEGSLERLNGELERIAGALTVESPDSHEGWSAVARPIRETLVEDERSGIVVLLSGAFVLFLLACSNASNLVVNRAVRRRSEIALRQALGGSTRQAWEATTAECLLLGLAAAGAGVLLVRAALAPLVALNPTSSLLLSSAALDARSVAFALGLAMVSTVVMLATARAANRGVDAGSVRNTARGGVSHRAQRRWRKVLVGTQVAMSVVLVSAAAGLLGVMRELATRDVGFDPDGLTGLQFTLSLREYPDHPARARMAAAILESVRRLPGVRSASLTTNRFIRDGSVTTSLWVENHPLGPDHTFTPDFRRVGDGYFETAGIEVLRGRPITELDRADSPPVAVISQAMAAAYWPGEDPLGKRVQRTGGIHPWLTVVGVVGDVLDSGPASAARPTIYIPYAQNSSPAVNVLVRTDGLSSDLASRLRGVVREVDPGIALEDVVSVAGAMERTLAVERFRVLMMALLSAAGLLMAVVGLYGITAQSVIDRTGELGLRAALGASPRSAVTMIGRESGAVVIGGAVVGMAATAMLASLAGRLLPDVVVVTWPTLLGGTSLLVVTAALATLLAALKAAQSDPMEALRGS